ncbi:hypothetical protein [Pollutimonas subterranea]|nr:hypothetical protein [Pollutimonas subterranea]
MAKGQLRGNKEAKKPKQAPKPATPASPFGSTASKGVDAKKK